MEWTDTVLRDYVLPELRPDVVIDWMGPLDAAQHAHGVGSPQARDALRAIDGSLSRTIARMQALMPASRLDVVITSDHGFAQHTEGVNIAQALIAAGLKASAASTDVIVASQSQSMLFYVPSHDAGAVARLVEFLQRQPSVGAIFTRGGRDGRGSVPGTFSFDVTQGAHASRSPDVAVALNWTSSRNPYGVPGTHTIASGKTGPLTGGASGHGGLSPWVVRNTLILWGSGFKSADADRGARVTRRCDADGAEAAGDRAGTVSECVRPLAGGVAARSIRSQAEAIAPDADDGIGRVSSRAADFRSCGPRVRRRGG